MSVKSKRRICAVISFLGFMFSLGSAGGVETDTLPLGRGAICMFLGIAVFAFAAYKGGYMN